MIDQRPSSEMPMKITWGDCDAAGIHYYARTFDWFTNGRMDFFESQGLPYMEHYHAKQIYLVCLEADCRFKRMLRPEERITLITYLTSFSRTRMAFAYEIRKMNGGLAAEGETFHTFVDDAGAPFNFAKRYPDLWASMRRLWGE